MFADSDLWDDEGFFDDEAAAALFAQDQQAIAAQTLRYFGTFTDVCGTSVSVETTARVSF